MAQETFEGLAYRTRIDTAVSAASAENFALSDNCVAFRLSVEGGTVYFGGASVDTTYPKLSDLNPSTDWLPPRTSDGSGTTTELTAVYYLAAASGASIQITELIAR